MVGARGTISQDFVTTWMLFDLNKGRINDIVIMVLRGSIALLKYHCNTNYQ